MSKLLIFLSLITVKVTLGQTHCDGERYLIPVFSEIDSTKGVNYGENYSASGELISLEMDIYYPKQEFFTDRPLVLLAHGGSFIAGRREDMRLLCHEFAHRGFVAATIDYRLFDDFNQTLDSILTLDVVMKAVSDLSGAVRWFKHNASNANEFGIDTNYIIIGGASAGAITALQAGYFDAHDPKSSILDSIVDANGGVNGNTGDYDGYSSEVFAILNYSGALKHPQIMDEEDPPMFSAHDDGDPTVPYGSAFTSELGAPILVHGSKTLHKRATNLGIANQLITIENSGGHVSYFLDGPETDKYSRVVDSTFIFLENLICAWPVGTTAPADEPAISIYPNPTSGKFQIKANYQVKEIRIYSLQGRCVLTALPSSTIELPPGLKPGVYMLDVSDGLRQRRPIRVTLLR